MSLDMDILSVMESANDIAPEAAKGKINAAIKTLYIPKGDYGRKGNLDQLKKLKKVLTVAVDFKDVSRKDTITYAIAATLIKLKKITTAAESDEELRKRNEDLHNICMNLKNKKQGINIPFEQHRVDIPLKKLTGGENHLNELDSILSEGMDIKVKNKSKEYSIGASKAIRYAIHINSNINVNEVNLEILNKVLNKE